MRQTIYRRQLPTRRAFPLSSALHIVSMIKSGDMSVLLPIFYQHAAKFRLIFLIFGQQRALVCSKIARPSAATFRISIAWSRSVASRVLFRNCLSAFEIRLQAVLCSPLPRNFRISPNHEEHHPSARQVATLDFCHYYCLSWARKQCCLISR